MKAVHYIDGFWLKTNEAKISVFDLAILRGFGCFDFLRTYNQKPFMLEDHLKRFFFSAKKIDLKIPRSRKEITNIVFEGIKKNKLLAKELNIRMILTGGISEDSLISRKPSLIILFTPAVIYPRKYYQKGVKVITYVAKRELPEIKSLNYLYGIKAYQQALKTKAAEAIYVFQNKIFEGTTSNFFAIIDNKLITPKKEILFGITRKLVLMLAKKEKIQIEERDLFINEIERFNEAFITSSTKEIMPVIKIDNKIIGDGRVGRITKKMINAFWLLKNSQ